MIKDIKNLEKFYDAKVLAICSKPVSEKPSVTFESEPLIFDPQVFKAKFGTGKLPMGPNGETIHPRGPDGCRLDDESKSSEGRYLYYDRPDTPEPETEQQAKARLQEMWVEPR